MTLLLLFLALAIGFSFLCSILEAVILSLTPSYISSTRESGSKAGALLEKLKSNVDRPLAAILSLNTVAHTVGAAGVGAQAQAVFQNVPFSIISGILTLLILIFSEIIPKTLGAVYWRTLATPTAYILQVLVVAMWPLVIVSQAFSRLLTPSGSGATVSREELDAMADLGQREGVLDVGDAKILRSVIAFQDIKVERVLTPRPVVQTLDATSSLREVWEESDSLNFSRYPVLRGPEKIEGLVLRSEILSAAANDDWERQMSDLCHEAIIIPEQMPVKRAFALFLRKREHMAIVVDEFGSFSGVLTLEDVIETLIGHEIMDEGDTVEDMREYARRASVYSSGNRA
jgi:CBS domain containing-hemolysin-like protein